jgi:hypothetical protein
MVTNVPLIVAAAKMVVNITLLILMIIPTVLDGNLIRAHPMLTATTVMLVLTIVVIMEHVIL